MADLQQHAAQICFTVGAVLIHQDKVLLIKHKKLGWWLSPGGHVDPGELPHRAAERECWEETGIRVRAIDAWPTLSGAQSEYLPHPMWSNLHWISEERYQQRISRGDAINLNSQPVSVDANQRSCEQHFCLVYLVEPTAGVDYRQNIEETDGIGWFAPDEVADLVSVPDFVQEIHQAFAHHRRLDEQRS